MMGTGPLSADGLGNKSKRYKPFFGLQGKCRGYTCQSRGEGLWFRSVVPSLELAHCMLGTKTGSGAGQGRMWNQD